MRQDLASTCACKRQECVSTTDPVCAPLLYSGHEKTGILFVRHRDDLQCPHLRSYSYGEFCMSSERIDDYLGQRSATQWFAPGYSRTLGEVGLRSEHQP